MIIPTKWYQLKSSFKINTPAKILTIVDKLFNKPMVIAGILFKA